MVHCAVGHDDTLNQNYFLYNMCYKIYKGVSMDSPLSRLAAEILQHFEKQFMNHTVDNKNIIHYAQYEDDILSPPLKTYSGNYSVNTNLNLP
jgi:hypothetical protein